MESIKLNLGCGYKKIPGYINIDNRSECNPDLLHDICAGLPYDDNSIEEVRAYDILEHLPLGKTVFVIEEIYRVLKPDGRFVSYTPSTLSMAAFQDPYHRSFWNKNSWLYYMDDPHRNLYGIRAKFEGLVTDIVTNEKLNIIHTFCDLRAVK